MTVTALDNLTATIPTLARRGVEESFDLTADALQQARDRRDAAQNPRLAAEQFVSTALLTPLLAQARNDPFKSDLFHGGFTEDAFMQRFDQIVADRLSQRMSLPLVEAVYQQITRQAPEPGGGVDAHG